MSGELSYEGIQELRLTVQKALDAGDTSFIFDMREIRLVSSYGLSALIRFSKDVQNRKGTLQVLCTPGNIADMFDVTGISRIIPVFSSENDLQKHLV